MNRWMIVGVIVAVTLGAASAQASFFCSGTLRARVIDFKLSSNLYQVELSVISHSGCQRSNGESFAVGEVARVRIADDNLCKLCAQIKVASIIELSYRHMDGMGPNGVVVDEVWELLKVETGGDNKPS